MKRCTSQVLDVLSANRKVIRPNRLVSALQSDLYAVGHDEGDVVFLFVWTELTDFARHAFEQLLRWKIALLSDGFHQPLFAEFLPRGVGGLRCAVGV